MSFDCVVIGDQIAANLQNSLHCAEQRVVTSQPQTASRIINVAGGQYHAVCVISAGSYDYYGSLKTWTNLVQIRRLSQCKVYVWLKPISNPTAAEDVDRISEENGDLEQEIGNSSDGITPTSYKDLAAAITNQVNARGL